MTDNSNQPVTKESLSQSLGVPADQIDDEMVAAANAALSDYRATEEPESDDSPTSTAPDWKDPDGWETHYYRRSDIDGKDPLSNPSHPLHDYAKRLAGDPVRDETHPHHKIVQDNIRAARDAMQKAAEFEKRLNEQDDGTNDPAKYIYGGKSFQMVEDGSITLPEWLGAKDAYERSVAQEEESTRRELDSLDRDMAKLKQDYPDSDPEGLFNRFSPVTREGIANPNYKPLTFEEAYMVSELSKLGGLKGLQEKYADDGKKAGQKELLERIQNRSSNTKIITDADGYPATKAGDAKVPKTPEDYFKLTESERDELIQKGLLGNVTVAIPKPMFG